MIEGRAPTILDVARKAGVSFSTVSLSLRAPNKVASKTRERIAKAVAELGYVPDLQARSLIKKKGGLGSSTKSNLVIAFLTGVEAQDLRGKVGFESEFEQLARKYGASFQRMEMANELSPQKVLDGFYARGGNAVVIGPMLRAIQIDLRNFAVVRMSAAFPPFDCDAIDHSIFFETMDCYKRLRGLGYRAIGVILRQHDPPIIDDLERRGAICALQSSDGRTARRIPPLVLEFSTSESSTNEQLSQWMDRYKPDAVIGFNHLDYFCLQRLGIRAPEDIAFAALHIGDHKELSGMTEDFEGMAHSAFDLLSMRVFRLDFGAVKNRTELRVTYNWNPGQTTCRMLA